MGALGNLAAQVVGKTYKNKSKNVSDADRLDILQQAIITSIVEYKLASTVLFTGLFVANQFDIIGRRQTNNFELIVRSKDIIDKIIEARKISDIFHQASGLITDIVDKEDEFGMTTAFLYADEVVFSMRMRVYENVKLDCDWLSVFDGKYKIVATTGFETKNWLANTMIYEKCSFEIMYDLYILSKVYGDTAHNRAWYFFKGLVKRDCCNDFKYYVLGGDDPEMRADYCTWESKKVPLADCSWEDVLEVCRSLSSFYTGGSS